MRLSLAVVHALVGVASLVAAGCTFTHSLNDLQSGIADAGLAYPPHTIELTKNGDNYFSVSETFPTSKFGYTAYVAWDRDTFYFAVDGPTVASDPATWVLAYWGTAPSPGAGTRTGQSYGTQTPTLNFDATYHVRWKGDDSFISLMRSSPGGWQDGGPFPGRHQRNGQFVEFSVPLKAIMAPDETATRVRFVMALIHDAAPETTYASVPSTAVMQDSSFNPSYAHSFDFDLTGGTVPNRHPVQ